jgi:NAD(P)-dependent dehydrogenase (short-subunit alcohol dehydrogenase family)
MNAFSLNKKSALITGGTSGIGLATARQFIAAGAAVIITGRRKSGTETAKELGARFIQADLSSGEEIAALFAQIDTLDIVVNNAGIYIDDAALAAIDDDTFDKEFAINVRGAFQVLRAAVLKMKKGGAIVNVASVSGMRGSANSSVYNASKAALINLTQSLALELAGTIRVNAVSPGPIETEMWPQGDPLLPLMGTFVPMGRIGLPQEVAYTIQFLCSDAASFVTGHNLVVDGGCTAGTSPAVVKALLGK